jgi:hypothetical protein
MVAVSPGRSDPVPYFCGAPLASSAHSAAEHAAELTATDPAGSATSAPASAEETEETMTPDAMMAAVSSATVCHYRYLR